MHALSSVDHLGHREVGGDAHQRIGIVLRQADMLVQQTQHIETITGLPFQRWSRHRQWDVARDTLATHLALIDESLLREVGL